MNIHFDPAKRVIGTLAVAAILATMAGCSTLPEPRTAAPQKAPAPTARSPRPASAVTIKPVFTPEPVLVKQLSESSLASLGIVDSTEPEVKIDRADLPDLWARLRAGFALPEMDSPDVERFAQRFAATNWLEKLGPRARRYLYLLVTEAEKRELPTELALLPIIESGLNPLAQSPAAAAGLCQFIPATGKRFGLQQSALTDQRRDLSCIEAMYEYLALNAAQFKGDWFLALASYNWGEGAVTRAIERNARNGLPSDYLSLNMPNETRAYVPQLLALRRLIQEPERYSVLLPKVENRPTVDCEVPVPRDMDVALVARLAGISVNEFQLLNAGVKKSVIPRATYPTICLPFESAVHFIVNVTEHKGRMASLTTYTVLSRTTLAALAKRYRTTPEAIRQANNIPPGMRLKSGATVLVPKAPGQGDISLDMASNAQTTFEPDVPDTRKLTIKSKRRDTLASLSKRHKVLLTALLRWNPGVKDPLKAGQSLVLHVPVKAKIAETAPETKQNKKTKRKESRQVLNGNGRKNG